VLTILPVIWSKSTSRTAQRQVRDPSAFGVFVDVPCSHVPRHPRGTGGFCTCSMRAAWRRVVNSAVIRGSPKATLFISIRPANRIFKLAGGVVMIPA